MTYNPNNQYRCTIIRGKSQSDMENLLPFYSRLVHQICPCEREMFNTICNARVSEFFFGSQEYDSLSDSNQKTVRNHITEIIGKLLGLYYVDSEGIVYESESCTLLVEENDFPKFFKNICYRMQFPNGSQKIQTVKERVDNNLRISPFCYVVRMLKEAEVMGLTLTKQEVGYYALNNLDVLQGKADASEVVKRISEDRKSDVKKDTLTGSHDWQHIKEMFNLLELSNIVITDAKYIWLNKREREAIELFAKKDNTLPFDIYKYNLDDAEDSKRMFAEWQRYYSQTEQCLVHISTDFGEVANVELDGEPVSKDLMELTKNELGKMGEELVYKLELERVRKYKERLANKVLLLADTKGLGYDISSVEANENPKKPEFARYIEVKSTRRVTVPQFDDTLTDSMVLTSKEWIAAEQYGEYYNIYRVYFTREKTIIARIHNPYKLSQEGVIEVYAKEYQMDINKNAISNTYDGR